ncbi:hypothetical protein D9M73_255380 [compost metagenome]
MDVLRGQPGRRRRAQRLAGQRGGIAAPGEQAVEQHGDQQDHADVEQHRGEQELVAEGVDARAGEHVS